MIQTEFIIDKKRKEEKKILLTLPTKLFSLLLNIQGWSGAFGNKPKSGTSLLRFPVTISSR